MNSRLVFPWVRLVSKILILAVAAGSVSLRAADGPSPVPQHADLTVTLGHDDGIFYIQAPPPPPPLNLPPGSSLTLVTGFSSTAPSTTRWFKNSKPLPGGQPAAAFEIAAVTEADSGIYHAEITLADRTVITRIATVRVGRAIRQQLLNISTRATINPSNPRLIVGFVVSPSPGELSEKKRILLRAVGPTLATVGVPNALAAPKLELFDARGASVPLTDDWLAPYAAAATGASALPAGSRDIAHVVTLSPGIYSAHVSSADGGSGDVVAEVYDIPEDALYPLPAAAEVDVVTPPPSIGGVDLPPVVPSG